MVFQVAKCIVVLLSLSVLEGRKLYTGYRVVDVKVKSVHDVDVLLQFENEGKINLWSEPRFTHGNVEVLVHPQFNVDFVTTLRRNGINFRTLTNNVEERVNRDFARFESRRDANGKMNYDFNDYNDYDAMLQQIQYFVGNCSGALRCTFEDLGTTFEGRPIQQFYVTTAEGSGRMGVWIDSLIHAREWLAGTSVMNIMNHMLNNYGTDPEVTSLMDTYDFYFIPIMNPDGYVFSWEMDRFWRKSRNTNAGSDCFGTDLNRNYDNSWGTDGTSTSPCSDTYGGPSPASAPETQTIQARANELGPNLRAFITTHTAANMYLHPFGNTLDGNCEYSADHDHQFQVAEAGARATMAAYDTIWTYGNTCETIYPASGITSDYAYGVSGVKYSYTPELRGPGFDAPPENIEPGWREYWAGIVAMIAEIEAIEN